MVEYVVAFFYVVPAIPLFVFFFLRKKHKCDDTSNPRSYPLLGHLLEILRNKNRMVLWMAELVNNSPSSTFSLRSPLRPHPYILTSNPSNVQHILKTRFDIYQKPRKFRDAFHDLFRDNLFLADGQDWRKLRPLISQEFNSRSFHKFVKLVTENEVSNRLIPLLSTAATNNNMVDIQDIFRRFTFDVVVRMALGHDLAYLPSSFSSNCFPQTKFANSFESAKEITWKRFVTPVVIWKAKRYFNMGSEKRLKLEITEMREFLREIIKRKKEGLLVSDDDFISGIMNNCANWDEEILINASINFVLGGVEVLTALIWYFWSVSKNPKVEDKIVKEVTEKMDIREMIYTHASILESLRFYPPFSLGAREAVEDDMLPDGTKVKKGTSVFYHTYAMGRSSELWGCDWPEFRPERWLKKEEEDGRKLAFMPRNSFIYPVFHGGPRICLGKEIAIKQIKTVVAGVLRRFQIAPAMEEGREPVFLSNSSAKMTNGFLVEVVDRNMHIV